MQLKDGVIAAARKAPRIVSSNFFEGVGATTHNLVYPPSIVAGNLLIMFVMGQASSAITLSTPSGFTALYNGIGAGNMRRLACFWKIAAGTEAGTVAVTTSTTTSLTEHIFQVTGWDNTGPIAGTIATGTSAAGDPPSLSLTWSPDKTLMFAHVGVLNGTADAPPSGYTQFADSNVRMGTAFKYFAGSPAAEDSGAFTLSASLAWGANIVAVRGV